MSDCLKPEQLFSRKTGRADNYRIPALLNIDDKVIVAAADERFFTGGDNPNRIDKVVRLSHDGGVTFGKQIVAYEEVGKEKSKSSAAIDPCLVYCHKNNKLFMLYSHTPAGIGILNNKKGTGYDANGRKIIFKGRVALYVENNRLVDKHGVDCGVTVDSNGEVRGDDGKYICNYKIFDGEYGEYKTSYLYIVESDDLGETWGTPRCLNTSVKEEYMNFIGAGPGIGIEIQHGKYAGRLVLPIYYSSANVPLAMSNAMVYSDDGGATWTRGGSPNDVRRKGFLMFKPRRVFAYGKSITESQLIELPDGTLKVFMRNHDSCRRVATALSTDGGETWHDFKFNENLTQCICQLSVLNVQYKGKEATLFLNASSTSKREDGVLRLSYDYGETFVASKLVKDGEFVYSCMAQLPDGDIGILYEGSTMHETVDYLKLPIDWILNKE